MDINDFLIIKHWKILNWNEDTHIHSHQSEPNKTYEIGVSGKVNYSWGERQSEESTGGCKLNISALGKLLSLLVVPNKYFSSEHTLIPAKHIYACVEPNEKQTVAEMGGGRMLEGPLWWRVWQGGGGGGAGIYSMDVYQCLPSEREGSRALCIAAGNGLEIKRNPTEKQKLSK